MTEHSTISDILKELPIAVQQFCHEIEAGFQSNIIFRRVSFEQVDRTLPKIQTVHSLNKPDDITAEDWRIFFYSTSQIKRYIEVFCGITRASCYEHAQALLTSIDEERGIVPFILMRGIIERLGKAELVRLRFSELLEGKLSNKEIERLWAKKHEEAAIKALYGTKFDAASAMDESLENFKKGELQYQKPSNAGLVDETALHVLTGVEKLNKLVPGTYSLYEGLCEYLHPNYDFLALTNKHRIASIGGVTFVRREFNLEPSGFATQGSHVLNVLKYLRKFNELLVCSRDIFSDLDEISSRLIKYNKWEMHTIVKKNKLVWPKDALCPCLSGRTVGKCKS